ncbi:hypothetical protein [Microbulbifer hainanensis]|uniref:hypothetical protein n=1 Tax=Microbulbifer hainanensis TaxID=2735675 RepID=UPI001866228A|nr:hypothetical protein [Microbulbifer hainanensis]
MKKPALILLSTLVATGCSGVTFKSNLGTYTAGKVVAASVKEYSPVEIGRYDADSLGMVEASECQKHVDEPELTNALLVRKLKIRVHDLGGNGVVVESCSRVPSGACTDYMECRGTAYAVPYRQSRP